MKDAGFRFYKKEELIMTVELKELSMQDGKEIFDMIKEIGPGENGFINYGFNMKYEQFSNYLQGNIDMSRGVNLSLRYVPQTTYWLYIDGSPVGIGKIRAYLNAELRREGGHIGYTIRPSKRGRGYGKLMLRELLCKAKERNMKEVLITCYVNNTPSRRIIEGNGGILNDIVEGKCRYWVKNL